MRPRFGLHSQQRCASHNGGHPVRRLKSSKRWISTLLTIPLARMAAAEEAGAPEGPRALPASPGGGLHPVRHGGPPHQARGGLPGAGAGAGQPGQRLPQLPRENQKPEAGKGAAGQGHPDVAADPSPLPPKPDGLRGVTGRPSSLDTHGVPCGTPQLVEKDFFDKLSKFF